MQKFNANITRSNSYFCKKCKELEVLIQQESSYITQFTLLATNNYQLDLNKIIYADRPLSNFSNEDKIAKQQKKLVKDNLYIIDSYFMDRANAFINIFYSKTRLEYSRYQFHIEYQNRGTAHIHSYLQLKENPGTDELAQKY